MSNWQSKTKKNLPDPPASRAGQALYPADAKALADKQGGKITTNNHGLSLIEIMVSFMILTIAFIGLIQAFPFSQAMNKTAENATKASYLAQEKIEQLQSLGYSGIAVGVIEAKQRLSADPSSYLYYFHRQTEVNYVDGNLQTAVSDTGMKKISTTVYYTNSISKTEKSYNITTLISNR